MCVHKREEKSTNSPNRTEPGPNQGPLGPAGPPKRSRAAFAQFSDAGEAWSRKTMVGRGAEMDPIGPVVCVCFCVIVLSFLATFLQLLEVLFAL